MLTLTTVQHKVERFSPSHLWGNRTAPQNRHLNTTTQTAGLVQSL